MLRGMLLGLVIGVAIGIVTDQLAIWIGVGMVLGAGSGLIKSQKKDDDTGDKT